LTARKYAEYVDIDQAATITGDCFVCRPVVVAPQIAEVAAHKIRNLHRIQDRIFRKQAAVVGVNPSAALPLLMASKQLAKVSQIGRGW